MLEERLQNLNSILNSDSINHKEFLSALELLIEPIINDEFNHDIQIESIKNVLDRTKINNFDNVKLFPEIFQSSAKISVLLFTRVEPNEKLDTMIRLFSQAKTKFWHSVNQIDNLLNSNTPNQLLLNDWFLYSTGLLETSISFTSALLLFDHGLDYNNFWVSSSNSSDSLVNILLKTTELLKLGLEKSKMWPQISTEINRKANSEFSKQLTQMLNSTLLFFTDKKMLGAQSTLKTSVYSTLAQIILNIHNLETGDVSFRTSLSKNLLLILETSEIKNFPNKDIMATSIKAELGYTNKIAESILKLVHDSSKSSEACNNIKQVKLLIRLLRFSAAQSTKLFKVVKSCNLDITTSLSKEVFLTIDNLLRIRKIEFQKLNISTELTLTVSSAADILFDTFVVNSLFQINSSVVTSILSQSGKDESQKHANDNYMVIDSIDSTCNLEISGWISGLDSIDKLLILQSFCFHFNQIDFSHQIQLLARSQSHPSLISCLAILADQSLSQVLCSPSEFQITDNSFDLGYVNPKSDTGKYGSSYHSLVLSISFPILSLDFGTSYSIKGLETIFKLWWADFINVICTSSPTSIGAHAAIDAYLILAKKLHPSLIIEHIMWILNLVPKLFVPSLAYTKSYFTVLIHESFSLLPSTNQFELAEKVIDLYNQIQTQDNLANGTNEKINNIKPSTLIQKTMYLVFIPWSKLFSPLVSEQKACYSKIMAALQHTLKSFGFLLTSLINICSGSEIDSNSDSRNLALNVDPKSTLEISVLLDALHCLFAAKLPQIVFDKCTPVFNSRFISVLSNPVVTQVFVKSALLTQMYKVLSVLVKNNTNESFSNIFSLSCGCLVKAKDKRPWVSSSLIEFVTAYSTSPNHQELDNKMLEVYLSVFASDSRWYILQYTAEKVMDLLLFGFDSSQLTEWIKPTLARITEAYFGEKTPISASSAEPNFGQLVNRYTTLGPRKGVNSYANIERNWISAPKMPEPYSLARLELCGDELVSASNRINELLSHKYISNKKQIPNEANNSLLSLYKTLSRLYN